MRCAARSTGAKEYMEVAGKQEPDGPAAAEAPAGPPPTSNTGLTSTAPHTTVRAANAPPSQPLAGPQLPPAAVSNPPSGRHAGTIPAHHAAQTGATSAPAPPSQTSYKSTPTAPNHSRTN